MTTHRLTVLAASPEALSAPFEMLERPCGERWLGTAVLSADEAEVLGETQRSLGRETLIVRADLRPALIVMDIDSTLIDQEVIDVLAAQAGVADEVARITEEAMAGGLDFRASLEARLGLLAGIPATRIAAVREHLSFTPGVPEFVAAAQAAGATVALVSGGFQEIAEPLAAEIGIDRVLANRLEIVDGLVSGRVDGRVIDRAAKETELRRLTAELGVSREETIAIGDGANDIAMISAAGTGVAFCAKPALEEHADLRLRTRRMDALWTALTGEPA